MVELSGPERLLLSQLTDVASSELQSLLSHANVARVRILLGLLVALFVVLQRRPQCEHAAVVRASLEPLAFAGSSWLNDSTAVFNKLLATRELWAALLAPVWPRGVSDVAVVVTALEHQLRRAGGATELVDRLYFSDYGLLHPVEPRYSCTRVLRESLSAAAKGLPATLLSPLSSAPPSASFNASRRVLRSATQTVNFTGKKRAGESLSTQRTLREADTTSQHFYVEPEAMVEVVEPRTSVSDRAGRVFSFFQSLLPAGGRRAQMSAELTRDAKAAAAYNEVLRRSGIDAANAAAGNAPVIEPIYTPKPEQYFYLKPGTSLVSEQVVARKPDRSKMRQKLPGLCEYNMNPVRESEALSRAPLTFSTRSQCKLWKIWPFSRPRIYSTNIPTGLVTSHLPTDLLSCLPAPPNLFDLMPWRRDAHVAAACLTGNNVSGRTALVRMNAQLANGTSLSEDQEAEVDKNVLVFDKETRELNNTRALQRLAAQALPLNLFHGVSISDEQQIKYVGNSFHVGVAMLMALAAVRGPLAPALEQSKPIVVVSWFNGIGAAVIAFVHLFRKGYFKGSTVSFIAYDWDALCGEVVTTWFQRENAAGGLDGFTLFVYTCDIADVQRETIHQHLELAGGGASMYWAGVSSRRVLQVAKRLAYPILAHPT